MFSMMPDVEKRWKEKCEVRAKDTPLAAIDFGALIALFLPILLEMLMGKFGSKSKSELKEHVKEAGYWTKMYVRLRAKRLMRRKRRELKIDRGMADDAAEVMSVTLFEGVAEDPDVVDGVIDETDDNRSDWEEWI